MVDMGKLAFAPATPEVLRLAKHLDKKHEFFGESFYGVFRCNSYHRSIALILYACSALCLCACPWCLRNACPYSDVLLARSSFCLGTW